MTSQARWRENRLVILLWVCGMFGAIYLLRRAWFTPIDERDFVAMWAAGKLAATGHVQQVYDTELFRIVGAPIAGSKAVKLAYPYPPHALFVAVPLSYLPQTVAYIVWQSISAALFYLGARRFLPSGFPTFLAVLTPASMINICFGQVGLIYGALWLFAFGGSSFAAAALTFKPHLGALVGVEVIRRRRIVRTIAFFALLIVASVAAFGIESWLAWIRGAATYQLANLTEQSMGIWRFQMVTPFLGYRLVGWLAFAAAGIFLLIKRFDVFTAATAAFLIAPYGFHYDMTVTCLGFGLLLFQKWRELPAWQTFICAAAFILPDVVALGTWIASPLLLIGLYIQTRNPITKEGSSLWPWPRSELVPAT
jgi:hypothetical protein